MALNYLKLAFRLLLRNPFFTIINVLGLSVGFAGFYILWPYTQSELKSDQFHQDYENIALLTWHNRWTENNRDWNEFQAATNFCGIARQIADEFSELKEFTRFIPQQVFRKPEQGVGHTVYFSVYQNDSTKQFFHEEHTAYADANFFEFFSFPLELGDARSVLSEPGSVVISQRHRIKFFGDTNPINSIIYLNDSIPLKVTGVFKELPRNTHLRFDLIITSAGIDEINSRFTYNPEWKGSTWMGANYIKIAPGVQFTDLERKIDDRRKELYGPWDQADPTILVHPLKDLSFIDFIQNPFVFRSNNALTILRALSLIILFLAWTNFISLSITTVHKRMPEVGTRKVVGARIGDFVFQFFVESAIINFCSLLLALTLVQLVKAPVEFLFHFYVADWKTMVDQHFMIILLMPVVGVVITSIYPVLISSRKGAADLLKKLRTIQMPWWIRSMVTMQYASAVVLLIWIGAVYFQLNYVLNMNTGVNQDGILVVSSPLHQKDNYVQKLDNFINKSLELSDIHQASVSNSVMGDPNGIPFFVQHKESGTAVGLYSNGAVDERFLDLYGIRLLEGRNFQSGSLTDQNAVLLSRNAVNRLGLHSPKASIGTRLILPNHNNRNVEVIGVYDDYEFEPYFVEGRRRNGTSSILTYQNQRNGDVAHLKISFKINLKNTSSIISGLENLYKAAFPEEVFQWTFLDNNIAKHYAQEQIVRNQIMLFTFLAIGIACLGLLGTTSNKAIEKTKEIGIRKVLGAQIYQIAGIILNTTLKQVIIANVVGIPIAYYLVHDYLQRYSEQMSFQWWHYALPVALLILIMFLTVAGVLLKAATTNPVESLRSE